MSGWRWLGFFYFSEGRGGIGVWRSIVVSVCISSYAYGRGGIGRGIGFGRRYSFSFYEFFVLSWVGYLCIWFLLFSVGGVMVFVLFFS